MSTGGFAHPDVSPCIYLGPIIGGGSVCALSKIIQGPFEGQLSLFKFEERI